METPRVGSYSAADLVAALAKAIEGTGREAEPVVIDDADVAHLAKNDPHFGSVWCYVTQVAWDERSGAWRLHVR